MLICLPIICLFSLFSFHHIIMSTCQIFIYLINAYFGLVNFWNQQFFGQKKECGLNVDM